MLKANILAPFESTASVFPDSGKASLAPRLFGHSPALRTHSARPRSYTCRTDPEVEAVVSKMAYESSDRSLTIGGALQSPPNVAKNCRVFPAPSPKILVETKIVNIYGKSYIICPFFMRAECSATFFPHN